MTSGPDTRFGYEHVTLTDGHLTGPPTWWSGYAASLAASGIGDVSRKVIEADATYIVQSGILGAGAPAQGAWPDGRVRTGAVMGAVQSGKTASMMAVTALALDAGVNAVVLLGGTRTALWLQTVERVLDQLDVLPDKATRRYLLPSPTAVSADGGPDVGSAYRLSSQQAERALVKRRPLIAVVMKNVAHLASMAETLHSVVYPAAGRTGEPFHLLVIDDEADDSTVVDEWETDPAKARQVPRRVRDLWESRQSQHATTGPSVFATYVAYTATPQANILQDADNPLAPRHFFASLRTPGAEGDWQQRTATYRVPEGARAWYTGGKVFYEELSDVPLCVDVLEENDADAVANLVDAVRAYLVACAVRLNEQPGAFGPAAARTMVFGSQDEAKTSAVKPMSMLVHPSPAMDDHFAVAAGILGWAAGAAEAHGRELLRSGARTLSTTGIALDMERHAAKWLQWLDSYRHAAGVAVQKLDLSPAPEVPALADWPAVRALILEQVVPGTSVAVINSDEQADDRPRFSPVRVNSQAWRPSPNLSTIFVSGNVMSRGLTLEGLTTTLFSRRSHEPLADTQMQMQRWFGYRGALIHLCRVFLTSEQRGLFLHYHQNDEALRRDVLAAMTVDGSARPALTVLQGRSFLATGKINRLRSTPLWPGPKPFVKLMNQPKDDLENLELVASRFEGTDCLRVPGSSGRQGLVLPERLTLLETADLLDALRYAEHRPGLDGAEAARWASVQAHAGMVAGTQQQSLYRPPAECSSGRDLGTASPYWIAAYLRLWHAAVDRRIPGMYTTDEPSAPWSLLNLAEKRLELPRFSVGVRFGRGRAIEHGPLTRLPVFATPMDHALAPPFLRDSWGSRGAGPEGIRGDETFDLRARGLDELAADVPRPRGSDGQVLFHLIERGPGVATVAVGVVIPLGGPDNLEARRSTAP